MRHSNTQMFCLHIFRSMSLFFIRFIESSSSLFQLRSVFFFLLFHKHIYSHGHNSKQYRGLKLRFCDDVFAVCCVLVAITCTQFTRSVSLNESNAVLLLLLVFFCRFHIGTIINVPILEEAQFTVDVFAVKKTRWETRVRDHLILTS